MSLISIMYFISHDIFKILLTCNQYKNINRILFFCIKSSLSGVFHFQQISASPRHISSAQQPCMTRSYWATVIGQCNFSPKYYDLIKIHAKITYMPYFKWLRHFLFLTTYIGLGKQCLHLEIKYKCTAALTKCLFFAQMKLNTTVPGQFVALLRSDSGQSWLLWSWAPPPSAHSFQGPGFIASDLREGTERVEKHTGFLTSLAWKWHEIILLKFHWWEHITRAHLNKAGRET